MTTGNIIPYISGIYLIICSHNLKLYVGSTNNFNRRWKEHRKELRNNIHHNRHLQNAWNKYGEASFCFIAIECVGVDNLTEREQFWLDTFQPYGDKGYNIGMFAECPARGIVRSEEFRKKIGLAHKGKKLSPEQIALMSIQRKGRPRPPFTDETKRRISEASLGKQKKPEHIEKIAEKRRKSYIVISPEGSEFLIKGMRRFCSEYNLDDRAMIRVAQGKQRAHKGWKCKYA